MLRQAGQSLRDRYQELFDDFTPWLMLVCSFIIVTAVEFLQKFAGQHPDPRFWLILTAGIVGFAGAKAFRLRARLRNLRRGEWGERNVSDILDRLRPHSFVPVHDLPGTTGNVDHVVVGPSGVYAIETKMRSGNGTIDYRANGDLIVGKINDKRALWQARSAAATVGARLRAETKTNVWVKPLVVFVGNWRLRRSAGDYDVDVVTASQLEDYFARQQPELTRSEIAHIASHLERDARN